jgi:hypothetical protein
MRKMNATCLELMNIHARALFTHNAKLRLLFVNEPDSAAAPAPRLFLGRTRIGNVGRFRADLPENLIQELDSLCASEAPMNTEFNQPPRYVERYVRLLEKHAPVERVSTGPAYYFPENLAPSTRPIAITENDAKRLLGGYQTA